ncbi:MAG: iron chelate uptake ABC transporter family permease subunit [Limnochordales bacterium]|nr:iron chelate uptake ABC transporter family permease subunit [Limnochordales bacterium]
MRAEPAVAAAPSRPVVRPLVGLALGAAALMALFLVINAAGMWGYVLPRRAVRVAAMALAGLTIGASTVIFQSITANRILTPGLMGLDRLYVLIQSAATYFLGAAHPWVSDLRTNFFLCAGVMALFAVALQRLFLSGRQTNIYVLLLVGVVAGTLFDSLASFLVVLIDPNEFLIIQSRMFASFNRISVGLLWPAAAAVLAVLAWLAPSFRYLDVLALGRDHAVSLGVNYYRVVRQLLIAVFLLVAVSTALVGPITFLGLIVANVAYELLDTYRRVPLMAAASLGGVIALVGGQLILEHLLVFSVPLPVLINFAGGVLFMYLLFKERSAW